MSAVEVTITGLLYDRINRTTQNVVLIGEAMLTGLGPGGGPIIPPVQPPGEGGKPPGFWGPQPGFPTPPIVIPPLPDPVPPNVTLPPPGSPPVVLPGATPEHPITPPPAIVVEYPGIGRVLVPQPLTREPKPSFPV